MKKYLKKGASIHAVDEEGMTAFLYITRDYTKKNEHLELIQFLMENGADLKDRSSDGKTPFIFAVDNGYMPIIQYLIV